VNFLVKTLSVSKDEIVKAIHELKADLENCGVRVVFHNDEVTLVTAPEFSETIEKIVKEEREKDLGRAGVETLAIIAYKGPVSKKEIEYIRGVNCQWALRSLLLRGLVEKKGSDKDERVILYSITTDAIMHLGLSHISELPEYEEVKKQLESAEIMGTETEGKDEYGE